MLTVRNLRPEPTLKDWFRENTSLLAVLALWALAMFWLGGSHIPVEGQLAANRTAAEDPCFFVGDALVCKPGAELELDGPP